MSGFIGPINPNSSPWSRYGLPAPKQGTTVNTNMGRAVYSNTNNGQVLGANTGSSQANGQQYTPTQAPSYNGPSPEDILNQGYNDYFASLDSILNGLGGQRSALEQGANASYQGSLADIQGQRAQGLQDIAGYRTQATNNQAKSLRQLAGDVQNQYQAGNVYLGTRGAGDSSAANQYGYAVGKVASQQSGDIRNQTNDVMTGLDQREQRLGDIYNTEVQKLTAARDGQIADIANWFYTQQNQVAQLKGQGAQQKSQQLLQIAMQNISNIQAQYQNQQSMLQQWALNNSTTAAQARQNLSAVSQAPIQGINYQAANLRPQMGGSALGNQVAFGYGVNGTPQDQLQQKGIFG